METWRSRIRSQREVSGPRPCVRRPEEHSRLVSSAPQLNAHARFGVHSMSAENHLDRCGRWVQVGPHPRVPRFPAIKSRFPLSLGALWTLGSGAKQEAAQAEETAASALEDAENSQKEARLAKAEANAQSSRSQAVVSRPRKFRD